MTIVVVMVARYRIDSVNVMNKDTAVTIAKLCQHSSCLPRQCLFGCINGRRRPISSFDELLSMEVLTATWWMLKTADLPSCGSASYCWKSVLNWPIRDCRRSGRSSDDLWLRWSHGCCGRWHARANCLEIGSLCRRTCSFGDISCSRWYLSL